MTLALLIDDHKELLDIFQDVLAYEGIEAIKASNPMEGIALAKAQRPDVILCDLTMPALTGREVRQQLLNDETTAHIPFVFISAHANVIPETGERWLFKPFTLADVTTLLREILGK